MSDGELAQALLLGKPYFGSTMAALQGPPARHGILDALLRTICRQKKTGIIRVLEVGSWAGASAVTFGTALRSLDRKGEILCVDLWEPYLDMEVEKDAHYAEMTRAAESHAIFHLFQHNLSVCNVQDLVTWRAGDSGKILPTLDAGSFDLIYIDGSHTYRNVLSDITNAKRLISEGGIIAGDDLELEWNEVDPTAHRAALESDRDYVMDQRANRAYHPGVTEAVHEVFKHVSQSNGVWALRKEGEGWAKVVLQPHSLRLPEHIAPFAKQQAEHVPETIKALGETPLFNLAQVGREFVALAKKLGPTSLMVERIGERDLGTLVLRDADLERLRNRIHAIEADAFKPAPQLISHGPHYNLVRLSDCYAAVSITLGPTSLLEETIGERELGELVLLDADVDRLQRRVAEISDRIEANPVPLTKLVAETPLYNLVRAGDTYAAVSKVLGPVAQLPENLGERNPGTLVLRDKDLDQLRGRIQAIEDQTIKPSLELVMQGPHYNLIRMGDRYAALSTSLGPTSLLEETIGERELGELVLLDDDLNHLQRRVAEITSRIEANRVPPTELVAETPSYNLIRTNDSFVAVSKALGPTSVLSEKLGERDLGILVLRDSDLDRLRGRIQSIEDQTIKPSLELVTQGPLYNLFRIGDRYAAVSTSLGPISLLEETLGERELGELVFLDDDLDRLEHRVSEIVIRTKANQIPAMELVAETPSYNLIRTGDAFVALAKALGPTALFTEKLGERNLGSLVLTDKDLDQLRGRIQAIEEQTIKPTLELVQQGSYYNLIRMGDRYAAVSQSLGPTALLEETIGDRELGELVLLDADLDRLQKRVAEICDREKASG